MLFNIVDLCSYYSQNGLVIVNVTDQILRLKEKDGTVVEIPSSVLPEGETPKVYKEKSNELFGSFKKRLFDGSLFINLEIEELQVHKCVYKEFCKTIGNSVFDIISKIEEVYPCEDVVIVGTPIAARHFGNFGHFGVVEPVYLEDGTIRYDKFKLYSDN